MLQGDCITLEYKMANGELLKYRSTIESHQHITEEGEADLESQSHLEMVMEQAVKSSKNELYQIEITITEGEISRDGEKMPMPNVGQKIGMSMKKSGDIVATTVDSSFSQPSFPVKALAIGETWTAPSTIEVPLADGGKKSATLNYVYKFSALDRAKGYEVAVIDITCPPTKITFDPEITQTITATGKTLFAHREGRLVSSLVETKTTVEAPGAAVTNNLQVKVELMEATQPSFGATTTQGTDEQYIIGV